MRQQNLQKGATYETTKLAKRCNDNKTCKKVQHMRQQNLQKGATYETTKLAKRCNIRLSEMEV